MTTSYCSGRKKKSHLIQSKVYLKKNKEKRQIQKRREQKIGVD